MSDTNPVIDSAALWSKIDAQHAARTRLAEETLAQNKAALFDVLAAADITGVLVTFDGVGDSGQIEGIDATIDGAPAELPGVEIEIATPTWDGSELQRRSCTLPDAIEALAYAFLEDTHDGWEDNEGAFGEFRFDVPKQTIALDYNERIETSEYHGHE